MVLKITGAIAAKVDLAAAMTSQFGVSTSPCRVPNLGSASGEDETIPSMVERERNSFS